MSELIDAAVRILRTLPEDLRENIAEAILDYDIAEFD